ncbi:MAG: tetratricopeptide repeat protein [Candidatus Aenigmatarchaeota archaeon]
MSENRSGRKVNGEKDKNLSDDLQIETEEFRICKEKIRSVLERGDELDDMTLEGFKHLIDGKIEESKRCFDSLSEKKNSPMVFYGQGIINLLLGDFQQAVRFFERSISLRPDFDEAWYEKGVALYELDRSQEALQCWKKARENG